MLSEKVERAMDVENECYNCGEDFEGLTSFDRHMLFEDLKRFAAEFGHELGDFVAVTQGSYARCIRCSSTIALRKSGEAFWSDIDTKCFPSILSNSARRIAKSLQPATLTFFLEEEVYFGNWDLLDGPISENKLHRFKTKSVTTLKLLR